MSETEIRVTSWPFDSAWAGYDDEGFPIYDRAVDSDILAGTFQEFFTDGVFPSNKDALNISKGDTFLNLHIHEGAFIIKGRIGVVPEGGIDIQLQSENGTVAHSIFLRYDKRINKRSCYITTRSSEPSSNPTPPSPDRETPGVYEYRLGYVVVPNGAANNANVTVTNEKGFQICPYAAPFVELDVDAIYNDARADATEYLNRLLAFFDSSQELIDTILDGTTAGYLQNQINDLEQRLAASGVNLSDYVDDKTIEYKFDKLQVKDGGISSDKIANNAITSSKIQFGAVSFSMMASMSVTANGTTSYGYYLRGYSQSGNYWNPVFSYETTQTAALNITNPTVEYINAPSTSSIGIVNCTNLSSINVPNATVLSNQAFANSPKIKEFNFSKIKTVGSSCFTNRQMSLYNVENLSDVANNAFSGCSIMNTCHWNVLENLSAVQSLSWYSSVYFSKLSSVPLGSYYGMLSAEAATLVSGNISFYSSVYLPNVTDYSGTIWPVSKAMLDFARLSMITGTMGRFKKQGIFNFAYASAASTAITLRFGSMVPSTVASCIIVKMAFQAMTSMGGNLSVYFESPVRYQLLDGSTTGSSYGVLGNLDSRASCHVDLYFPSSQYAAYTQYPSLWYWSSVPAGIVSFHSF